MSRKPERSIASWLLIARAVTGANTQTLPVVMWNGANEQISPALGAVSVMLMAITFAGFALVVLIRRRIEKEVS